jgi:hypothetical protein
MELYPYARFPFMAWWGKDIILPLTKFEIFLICLHTKLYIPVAH